MTKPISLFRTAVLAACCVGSLALSTAVAHAQGGFKVIVNSANAVSELSTSEVSNIFLKKSKKFPAGDVATPVDHAKGSAMRAAFSKSAHGRAASAVDTYWQQQIFGGGETPPPTKANDEEVVNFVKANSGAIGYVSAGASVSGVKVVTIK